MRNNNRNIYIFIYKFFKERVPWRRYEEEEETWLVEVMAGGQSWLVQLASTGSCTLDFFFLLPQQPIVLSRLLTKFITIADMASNNINYRVFCMFSDCFFSFFFVSWGSCQQIHSFNCKFATLLAAACRSVWLSHVFFTGASGNICAGIFFFSILFFIFCFYPIQRF